MGDVVLLDAALIDRGRVAWWTIHGATLLDALLQVEAGRPAAETFAELMADSEPDPETTRAS